MHTEGVASKGTAELKQAAQEARAEAAKVGGASADAALCSGAGSNLNTPCAC